MKREEMKTVWCAFILDLEPSWSIYQVINSISLNYSHLSTSFQSHCFSYVQAQKTASVVSPGPIASPQEHLHHNCISNTQLWSLSYLSLIHAMAPYDHQDTVSRLCGVALKALGKFVPLCLHFLSCLPSFIIYQEYLISGQCFSNMPCSLHLYAFANTVPFAWDSFYPRVPRQDLLIV